MSQVSDNAASEENKEEKKMENTHISISFIEQVEIALNRAKSENKILIVLCEKQQLTSSHIWNHAQVIQNVQNFGICLLIRDDTLPFKQFTALYPVIAFPTIYCINPQNGQVLQCKSKDQISVNSISETIATSYQTMIKQTTQTQTQTNQITQPQSQSPDPPKKKANAALKKLQQIREKAKAQKSRKSPTNINKTSTTQNTANQTAKQASKINKTKKTKTSSPLNNYNFVEDEMDAIKSMEITRRHKLRKRKKKFANKTNISNNQSQKPIINKLSLKRIKNTNKDDDIYAGTPILSAVKKNNLNEKIRLNNKKQARLSFRISDGVDVEKYFNYDDKLIDVMRFIITETGINDFIFISQYPPLHIDSIYLDGKMPSDIDMGVLDYFNGDGHDEKSNESMYDVIQGKLQKTLYELNLVPSCRVFIQSKCKGHERGVSGRDSDNIIVKIMYFIIDLIKIIVEYGYNGVLFVVYIVWEIINVPLKMMGITKDDKDVNNERKSYGTVNGNKRKSKLPAYKKNKRLQGKKSNMKRLTHSENDEDKNRYANGNNTMYGGDPKK